MNQKPPNLKQSKLVWFSNKKNLKYEKYNFTGAQHREKKLGLIKYSIYLQCYSPLKGHKSIRPHIKTVNLNHTVSL